MYHNVPYFTAVRLISWVLSQMKYS